MITVYVIRPPQFFPVIRVMVIIIGTLQVTGMDDENQTNEDLEENQIAILTFPSGIDVQDLLGTDEEDIGMFFVTYEQDVLFPRIGEEKTNDSDKLDPVGSAVVSFTIVGLEPGTILPEPISIDLRIANPLTGNSEVLYSNYSTV